MSIKSGGDKITKEFALFLIPLLAAYLFITFYEAGYAMFFGLPVDFIHIDSVHVILTNRFTLAVAVIAFLWIGLYYNILPSTSSPFFKGMITVILVLALSLGMSFGYSDAKHQIDFLVYKGESDQVVLRIYDDKIFTAPVNIEQKFVKRAFFIRPLGLEPDNLYQMKSIGPLTPQ